MGHYLTVGDDERRSERSKVENKDADSDANATKSQVSAASKVNKTPMPKSSLPEPKKSLGADLNKPACRKAKEIRREKWLLKKGKAAAAAQKQSSEKKCIEEFIEGQREDVHKLTIELLPCSMSDEKFRATFEESYRLYVKYQVAVHGDKEDNVSEKQFTGFLVDSPLVHYKPEEGPPSGYGSFHQQYRIDGKLIAVGVLDILPDCLSSVYVFYDPSYNFLTLGTYTALREIYFTRQLQKRVPDLTYYYMGYYIHSCQKMRYKGQYQPSFLLCPEVYSWIPIQSCLPKLDVSKYSRLDTSDASDGEVDINTVLVLWKRTAMPYKVFVSLQGSSHHELTVREYAQLAGPKASKSMLLYLE